LKKKLLIISIRKRKLNNVIIMKKKIFFLSCIFIQCNLSASSYFIDEAPRQVYPSSMVEINSQNSFLVKGEFIYWKAQEPSQFFFQPAEGAADGNDFEITQIWDSLQRLDSNWKPGFKIGLGYHLPQSGFDLSLDWLWYTTKADKSYDDWGVTLWGHYSKEMGSSAMPVRANWNLSLNTLDFTFAHPSFIGKYTSLNPFFGVRGVWFSQKNNIYYTYRNFESENNVLSGFTNPESKYDGFGIFGGCEGDYSLGWNLHFFGNIKTAAHYGFFDNSYRDWLQDARIADSSDRFWHGVGSVDLGAGLRFGSYLFKDRFHLFLQVGWEQNFWIGLNQFIHFLHEFAQGKIDQGGNISFQGINAQARFDF
jgi:hypothetical protein